MTSASQTMFAALRRPDLSLLGSSIKALPLSQWQDSMFFSGAPDKALKELSGGFPATLRRDKTTHPIFVLAAHPSGPLVCPCSSRGSPRQNRFIHEGCRLEMKNHTMDRNSYLIERYAVTLPLDNDLSRHLVFQGRVPVSCLVDRRIRG